MAAGEGEASSADCFLSQTIGASGGTLPGGEGGVGSGEGKPSTAPETCGGSQAQMKVCPVIKRKDRGSLKGDGKVNSSPFYVLLWYSLWALYMFPHFILANSCV